MKTFAVAFIGALVMFAWFNDRAAACTLSTDWSWRPDSSVVRLWLTAEADTVAAERWWRSPVGPGWSALFSPRSGFRVSYGQVAEVRELAGGGSVAQVMRDGLTASRRRVLLIPYEYGGDCGWQPWVTSAAWIPVGEPSLLVARPRPRDRWVSGMPTFDLLGGRKPYPHADALQYEAGRASSRSQWLSVAEYWELLGRLSSDRVAPSDRGAIMSSLRAWVNADSARARRFPANLILPAVGLQF